MRRAPPHLEERATTLEGALACALEAESFSQQQASRAHKLSHLLGVPAPAPALIKNGSESDDDDDTVQPPIVRRLPNLKVFLFDGLEYTGTYVGEVGDGGIPHGLGTFRDTTGFALTSGGIFSGSGGNKGDAEIRYRGQWVCGRVEGYGEMEQGSDQRRRGRFSGRFVAGLKDGYGVARFPPPPRVKGLSRQDGAIFYQGEYLQGRRHGQGMQFTQEGRSDHLITPKLPPPSSSRSSLLTEISSPGVMVGQQQLQAGQTSLLSPSSAVVAAAPPGGKGSANKGEATDGAKGDGGMGGGAGFKVNGGRFEYGVPVHPAPVKAKADPQKGKKKMI